MKYGPIPRFDWELITIPIDPPFEAKRLLNKWGTEKKDFYLTPDVCKILGIDVKWYYYREKIGCFPKPKKIGVHRIFKEKDIDRLLKITKRLKNISRRKS